MITPHPGHPNSCLIASMRMHLIMDLHMKKWLL